MAFRCVLVLSGRGVHRLKSRETRSFATSSRSGSALMTSFAVERHRAQWSLQSFIPKSDGGANVISDADLERLAQLSALSPAAVLKDMRRPIGQIIQWLTLIKEAPVPPVDQLVPLVSPLQLLPREALAHGRADQVTLSESHVTAATRGNSENMESNYFVVPRVLNI